MNMQKNYYKVVAKCGHVGKRYYFEGEFYVIAENGREAAAKARYFPRVKHDHKDAILSVTPISYEEFIKGRLSGHKNPYYSCLCKQEQELFWDEIEQYVYIDLTRIEMEEKEKPKKRHPLKDIFNGDDPVYQELRLYRGDISWIVAA